MSDDQSKRRLRRGIEEPADGDERSALARIDDATDGGVVDWLHRTFAPKPPPEPEPTPTPKWPANFPSTDENKAN